jgi:hypothetical protein
LRCFAASRADAWRMTQHSSGPSGRSAPPRARTARRAWRSRGCRPRAGATRPGRVRPCGAPRLRLALRPAPHAAPPPAPKPPTAGALIERRRGGGRNKLRLLVCAAAVQGASQHLAAGGGSRALTPTSHQCSNRPVIIQPNENEAPAQQRWLERWTHGCLEGGLLFVPLFPFFNPLIPLGGVHSGQSGSRRRATKRGPHNLGALVATDGQPKLRNRLLHGESQQESELSTPCSGQL